MDRELRRAAEHGNLELVKQCVEAGTDVNSQWGDCTPLHGASCYGHYLVVKYLLEKEADANFRTKYGTSPLIMACENNHQAIASLLLDYDAEPSLESDVYGTAELCALKHRWNFDQMKIQSYYRSPLYLDHLFCCAIEEPMKNQIIEREGEGIEIEREGIERKMEEKASSFLQNLMKNVHLSDLFISEEQIGTAALFEEHHATRFSALLRKTARVYS